MDHFIHLDYRILISHISSSNYQAVPIIEYSRKVQIQSQEEVIQLVQLILRHRISIGLPFYFDIQINVSPWFAAQKSLASHVASFPHICKLQRLFLSVILYDLSAILQAERLAFCLYDALKVRSTDSFSFLTILQYSKYCRFAIVR